jgi:hypothetical protein
MARRRVIGDAFASVLIASLVVGGTLLTAAASATAVPVGREWE